MGLPVPASGVTPAGFRDVWVDGQRDAPASALPVSALLGDGVFETLRSRGGQLVALDRHLARVERAARALDLVLPVAPSVLGDELNAARAARSGEVVVRLVLARGATPHAPHARGAPATRIVVVEPLPDAGADTQTALTRPYADYRLPVPSVKTTSYLPSLRARRDARALGVDELLLLDGDDVIEGATSNVFLVTDGRLVTPADDGRLLAGVTRARAIAHARAQGLAVDERTVRRRELHEAEEVFLTSTLRGARAVVALDGHPCAGGSVGSAGPVTRALAGSLAARD